MMYGKNVVKKGKFSFLLVVVLLLVFSGIASATVLRVPETYSTIQSAINAASTGDSVLVNDGTYYENINFNGKAITVISVNGRDDTTINGGANGSVVTFNDGEINGFTITNGYRTYGGGGIYVYLDHNNNSITISNCTISSNTAGSGIYAFNLYSNNNNSLTISNCTITGNTGGGIITYSSYATISGCTITENTATSGGGIYASHSTISDCTISGNTATVSGGGICGGYLTISNCTITENTAAGNNGGNGGGIYSNYDLTVSGCTITYNTAYDNGGMGYYGRGGGIYHPGSGHVTIENSTITDNTAIIDGGGLYFWNFYTPTLTNNNITGNNPNDIVYAP